MDEVLGLELHGDRHDDDEILFCFGMGSISPLVRTTARVIPFNALPSDGTEKNILVRLLDPLLRCTSFFSFAFACDRGKSEISLAPTRCCAA